MSLSYLPPPESVTWCTKINKHKVIRLYLPWFSEEKKICILKFVSLKKKVF